MVQVHKSTDQESLSIKWGWCGDRRGRGGSAGPSHSHNSDDRLLALVGTCLAGMELSFVATGEKEGRIRSRFVVDVLWIRACVKGAALVLYGHCSMINDA